MVLFIFALEPACSVSKKFTFFYWRTDVEARTASSTVSLDPYNNPLEILGGISIGILLTSLSDSSCFWILDHLQSICGSQGSYFQVYCLDWSSNLFLILYPHNPCCSWILGSTFGKGWTTNRASLVAQLVKNLPAVQETQVFSLAQEDPLEKGMATHSSIPAWRIPWTEEPGGLQFMRLQSRTSLSD